MVLVKDSTAVKAHLAKIEGQLQEMKKLVHTGDIVTRAGNDFTSESLRSLNRRDKTFSHCGIASIENDTVFIYHALGGEWNPDQRLLRERFETFVTPYENKCAGVFRFDIPLPMSRQVLSMAKNYYNRQLKFDLDFDLKTDDKLYCAEFVYKSFLGGTDSLVNFHHSRIGTFEFIGVDDITLDPHCVKIAVLNYGIY